MCSVSRKFIKELPTMKLITESTLFVLLLCCCFCCCCRCCITGSGTCWVECPESLTNLSETECFLRDDGTSESCNAEISDCENVTLLIDLTSKVQILYISIYNSVSNLEIGTIRSHPEVTLLGIRYNYACIHPDLLFFFPEISYLNLNLVEFQFLPYFSDSNRLLTYLRVDFFSITYPGDHNILRKGRVSDLLQLNYLYLWPNQFLNTTDESFSGLSNLRTLDLIRFHVPNPVATFSPLVKLNYLSYQFSELTDISFLSLTPSLFGLTYLAFSNNKITHIPSNVFLNYSNLLDLYLNYNGITTLEKDCFKGLSKLESLG